MHDPRSTRALLVAVDDYRPTAAPGPDPTPGPVDGARRLAELLTDPKLLGLAPEHCSLLRNPPDAATVLDAVYETAAAATGTFILYVSGFALSTPRHPDLYFALPGSSESRLYRALRYPDLAALVRETGRAADRIVILDYCYDGEIPPTHAAGAGGSADLEAVAGACVLAGTARDAGGWVPEGGRLTAFTGALTRALEQGLPDAGDELELAALHHHIGRELAGIGQPAPRLWPGHGERPIVLAHNVQGGWKPAQDEVAGDSAEEDSAAGDGTTGEGERAYGAATDPEANSSAGTGVGSGPAAGSDSDPGEDGDEVNTLPKVPDGQAPTLQMAPPALADWLTQLRVSGWPQVAEQVLAGYAGHAHPPNAALLLVVLRLADRNEEADRVASVLVQRPAGQCAGVAHALIQNGYREECERLLAAAGRRMPDQVNRLARALAARGGVPQAALLLAEATGHAPAGAAIEPYAEAFATLLGPPREAGALLAEATAHWPEGRVLTLAEELEAAGGAGVADTGSLAGLADSVVASFALYARSAQLAAGNWPPDRFAGLLARMAGAGAQEEIEALLVAAEKAVGPYPSLNAYLATALASAHVPALASRLLDHTVPSYSDVELVALSSYLEAGRQRGLAVHAYATAALSRPPSATLGYIDVLRRHGEPANADRLVIGVLTGRPSHVVGLLEALRKAGRTADVDRVLTLAAQGSSELAGAVARELWEAGAGPDAEYVLDGVAARPLVELAGALVELNESGGISAGRLDPQLRGRAPQEFIDAVAVLRAAGRDQEADLLFAALSRGGPGQVCAAALKLLQDGRDRDATELLDGFAVQAPAHEAVEAMALLAESPGGGQAAGGLLTAALAARPDPGSVLSALRRSRDPVQTDRYLEYLGATLPVAELVLLTSNLAVRGCEPDADLMLNRAAGRDDFIELRAAFHDAGRHAQAYHLTERRGEF